MDFVDDQHAWSRLLQHAKRHAFQRAQRGTGRLRRADRRQQPFVKPRFVRPRNHLDGDDRHALQPIDGIKMSRMVARELLDDHRLAHAALADDQEVGHPGALGKRDQILEHRQRLLRPGIVDPPVRANPTQAFVRTQGRDRAARGEQMSKILTHPIPPPRNRAARAAYPPPPAVRRSPPPRSTSQARIWVGARHRGA